MKNIKSIVTALSKNEGVSIFKNVCIEYATVGEEKKDKNNNPYRMVTCHLETPVRGSIRITKSVIADAEAEAERLKALIDEDGITADEKKKRTADHKTAKAYLDSLVLGEYTRGETYTIFLTNIAFIGMLRHNPATQFLVEPTQADPESLQDYLNHAHMSLIAEDVFQGDEYISPFSEADEGNTVDNDSVYHSGYNLDLGEYGWQAAEETRAILHELKKEKLREKLKSGASRRPVKKTKTYNEDED